MEGGFQKEGGAVGPAVNALAGSVLLGGILIYMGLRSLVGDEEEGRDNGDYKHENDDDDDDNQYNSRGTFPGRVVVGPDAERWNKGGGSINNNDNHNDHDDEGNDCTIHTNIRSTRDIMESSLSLFSSLSLLLLSDHLISKRGRD